MKIVAKEEERIICSKCTVFLRETRYKFFHPSDSSWVYGRGRGGARCFAFPSVLFVVRSRSNFTRRLNCTRGYSDISGRIRGWSAAARNVTDSSAANCIGITLGERRGKRFDLRLSLLLAIGPRGGGGDGGGGGGGEGKEAAGGKERWMEKEEEEGGRRREATREREKGDRTRVSSVVEAGRWGGREAN